MNTTFIYALIEPINSDIRYIGKSNNPEKRFKEHIYTTLRKIKNKEKLTHKENWINSLLKEGNHPKLQILDEVLLSDYEKWESFYIEKYKQDLGCDLVNADDTGLGMVRKVKELNSLSVNSTRKEVNVYNLSGIYINTMPSLREASRIYNVSHANISRCCNYEFSHSGGFIFRYSSDNTLVIATDDKQSIKKIVFKIDKNGNILEEYKSIADAAKINNLDVANISKVCNGRAKTTNKMIFKFKTNE